MLKEAIILAGGLGSRLRSVVREVPKSMALVDQKPFLEYLLDYFYKQDISRFIISVGYKSTSISEHFGNEYKGCRITYAFEEHPLGTGGAIKNSFQHIAGDHVVVTNGDSLFLADIRRQFRFHLDKKADVTLALKPLTNFKRYGTVEFDENQRITGFMEKRPRESGLINGGVYIFHADALNRVKLPDKFSIEKDFFQDHCDYLELYGFVSDGYFLDIGIPEDFAKAQDEFKRLTY